MATAAPPGLKIDLTETFGIGYIGSVISAVLYGITIIQTFHYFRASGKDPVIIKVLVFVLLILDTMHQALIAELVYHYLVLNFFNPLELFHNIWSIAAEIIVNAVIAFLVEGFLVARVWILSSKNKIVTTICGVLTVAHLVMNIVFPVKTLEYPNLITGATSLRSVGTGGLAVAVVTDVCISATLCYYLQKGRTGFKRSDDMITKLIALTITTGLLSTLIVIANLVALVSAPQKLYSLFFNFMLAKLYINALLTSLNARAAIRNGQSAKSSLSNTLSDSMQPHKLENLGRSANAGTAVNVVVDVGTSSDAELPFRQGGIEMEKIGSRGV